MLNPMLMWHYSKNSLTEYSEPHKNCRIPLLNSHLGGRAENWTPLEQGPQFSLPPILRSLWGHSTTEYTFFQNTESLPSQNWGLRTAKVPPKFGKGLSSLTFAFLAVDSLHPPPIVSYTPLTGGVNPGGGCKGTEAFCTLLLFSTLPNTIGHLSYLQP